MLTEEATESVYGRRIQPTERAQEHGDKALLRCGGGACAALSESKVKFSISIV